MLFQFLPEIQEKVFSYVPAKDLKRLACCSNACDKLVKQYLWHTVKIAVSQLLNMDVKNTRKLKMLKHTKVLHIFYTTKCSFRSEDVRKKIHNFETILKYCQPRVLYTAFVKPLLTDAISKIISLTELNVGCTGITDTGVQTVCCSLTQLKVLRITRNGITDDGIKYLYKLKSLELLHAAGSHITNSGLPIIAGLPKLKILFLGYCQKFTEEGFKCFTKSTTLKELNLKNTEMSDTILPHLSAITTLELLNIEETQITNSGLKNLAKFKNLVVLYAGGNSNITDPGMQFLAPLVSLKKLYLCEARHITDDGVLLLHRLNNLVVLDLGDSQSLTGTSFSKLIDMPLLTTLNVRRNHVVDDSLRYIGALVSVQYLDLSCNSITDRGLEYLANLVKLKELKLNENKGITGTGVAHFNKMTSLEKLELHWCRIPDENMDYIGAISSLRYLRLSENLITDVKPLGVLQHLIELDIRDCDDVTEEGLSYIAPKPALRLLYINKIKVSDAFLTRLRAHKILNVVKQY